MDEVHAMLERRRGGSGGFGPIAGAEEEVEPTAMVVLATGDPEGRAWLEAQQRPDAGFGLTAGGVVSDDTGLAALVLSPGGAREAALDHLVATRGLSGIETTLMPHDPSLAGWPWTEGGFGWIEPTSWGLLALRAHWPRERERRDDAVAMLRDRACVEGGWNYGNRIAFGVELPAFVQTTAMALLALHGLEEEVTARGLEVLAARWPDEAAGLLSHATAAVALRVYGHPDAEEAVGLLEERTRLDEADTVALAWAALAMGAGPEVAWP